jgi:hypothetical protein
MQGFPDDHSSANAGSHDDTENTGHVLTGSEKRLGKGEAVGVIFDADGPGQAGFKIALERLADQALRIGVLDAAFGINRTRRGNTDRAMASCPSLKIVRQRDDKFEDRQVAAVPGSGTALAGDNASTAIHQRNFCLGAAKVNADSHADKTADAARRGSRQES